MVGKLAKPNQLYSKDGINEHIGNKLNNFYLLECLMTRSQTQVAATQRFLRDFEMKDNRDMQRLQLHTSMGPYFYEL